jgi:hypothetical protein
MHGLMREGRRKPVLYSTRTQKYLPAESLFEQLAALQAVHDWPLDFAQMQLDGLSEQAAVDLVET